MLSTKAGGPVTITTVSGDIGTATAAIKTKTDTIVASKTTGLINLSDAMTGSTASVSALDAGGIVTFSATSPVDFAGVISGGGSVTLKTAGATGFAGGITSNTGSIKLTQTGTGVTSGGANVSAGTFVSLQTVGAANFGNITAKNGAVTLSSKGDATMGDVNASGTTAPVTITSTGSISLGFGGGSSATTTFSATAAGAAGISTTGAITSVKSITLKNTGKDAGISLNGALTVTDNAKGTAVLTATGTGKIEDTAVGADAITAKTVTLTSGTGAFGSAGTALRIAAASLAANSTGLMNLDNKGFAGGGLTLTAAKPAGQFTLNSPTGVTITPSLTNATAITISTAGAAGITLTGSLGNTKTTSAVILTTVSGDISGGGTINTTTGGSVSLITVTGNFGSSAKALKMNTPTLLTSNTTGLMNLSNARTAGLQINSGLVAGGALTLVSAGPTTFNTNIFGKSVSISTGGNTTFNGNSVTSSDGSISITASTGMLDLTGSTVSAQSVSAAPARITILEKANTATSGINLTNTTLVTDDPNKGITTFPLAGQISVVIGASVPAPVSGTQPSGPITVTPGTTPAINKVYWGTNNNFTVGATPSTFTIQGNSAIQFQSGTTAKITFDNANWTADPPAGPAAAVATQAGQARTVAPIIQNGSNATQVAPFASEITRPMHSQSSFALPSLPQQKTPEQASFSGASRMLQGGISSMQPAGEHGTTSKKPIAMRSGHQLISPNVDLKIETPFGDVEIDAGSVALVLVSDESLAVYALDDQHRDAIRVNCRGALHSPGLRLSPGRQLIVGSSEFKSFSEVNPIEEIAYRNINSKEIGKFSVFSAEFSIPSAIESIASLKNLLISKDSESVKLANHLKKTIAAMMQMKSGADRFQRMPKQKMALAD